MITEFEPKYADAVIAVWLAASPAAHPFIDAAFLRREAETVRNTYLPNAETWLWLDKGAVTGFIGMLGQEVGGLFVHPDAQGRGIGRKLLDHVVADRGTLELGVFEVNTRGRAFYARYGFREIGTELHDLTGQPLLHLVYP